MLGLPMSLNLTPVKPLAVGPKQRSPLKAGILFDLYPLKAGVFSGLCPRNAGQPLATGPSPATLRTSCRRTGQSR